MTSDKKGIKARISRIASNPKRSILSVVALALCAVLVCACTFSGATGGQFEEDPVVDPAPTGDSASPAFKMEMVSSLYTFTPMASSETGYYSLKRFDDANAQCVVYSDYATRQTTYLPAGPQVADATNPGWIENKNANVTIGVDDQYLYLYVTGVPGNPGPQQAQYVRMGLDGSNKTVFNIPAPWSIVTGTFIASDGSYLYTIGYQLDDNGESTGQSLLRLHFDTQTITPMFTAESGPGLLLIRGVYEDGIVLTTTDGGYSRFSLTTNDITKLDIASESRNDPNTHTVPHNGYIYLCERATGKIEKYDVATDTKTVLVESLREEGVQGEFNLGIGTFDELLLVTCVENGMQPDFPVYMIDTTSGAVSRLTLTDLYAEDPSCIYIMDETSDSYLVYVGSEVQINTEVHERKEVSYENYFLQYRLISKADLLAGNPNYISFEDMTEA